MLNYKSHKEQKRDEIFVGNTSTIIFPDDEHLFKLNNIRSEERRVGKECL